MTQQDKWENPEGWAQRLYDLAYEVVYGDDPDIFLGMAEKIVEELKDDFPDPVQEDEDEEDYGYDYDEPDIIIDDRIMPGDDFEHGGYL